MPHTLSENLSHHHNPGIFGRRSTSLIRIVRGLNANAISLSIWFQPYRYLNHCLHRSIEGPADSCHTRSCIIGVVMDVSSTRAYLMLDHIWIFISGYGNSMCDVHLSTDPYRSVLIGESCTVVIEHFQSWRSWPPIMVSSESVPFGQGCVPLHMGWSSHQ